MKVYCKDCKYFHYGDEPIIPNQCDKNMFYNKDFSCYERKWYKFWKPKTNGSVLQIDNNEDIEWKKDYEQALKEL